MSLLPNAIFAGTVDGRLFEGGPQRGNLVNECQDGVRVRGRDHGWCTGKLATDAG
jgi:hypothetical protein